MELSPLCDPRSHGVHDLTPSSVTERGMCRAVQTSTALTTLHQLPEFAGM